MSKIFVKFGDIIQAPYMTSYNNTLTTITFYGDPTYTDPFDGSVWNWENTDNNLKEIIGFGVGAEFLNRVTSIADCEVLEDSFFWEDSTGILYVHWAGNVYDFTKGSTFRNYSSVAETYASGIHELTNNVFDGIYYKPLITGLSGFAKKVDPIKLGLIATNESSITLSNQDGRFDNLSKHASTGLPVFLYNVPEDATELLDEHLVSVSYTSGIDNPRDSITYNLIERRIYENNPICPNIIDIGVYSSVGNNKEKLLPTPWGDVRRGIMLLSNADDLTTAGTETAVFIVADSSLGSVRDIAAVYDEGGNSISIDSFNLTNCTVSITKPADISANDLKKWSWEGEGYDITGTYNNALDIIKDAYLKLAGIPYINSTFNISEWDAGTATNTQPVGISVQSDKGFTEQLIEPCMTSLQGIVDIQGDGRITFINRDITASPTAIIKAVTQFDEPDIKINPELLVSELLAEYSPDFVNKESLSYLNSSHKLDVISEYNINRREPLSPVKTILVNECDVVDITEEIMSTSADPERMVSVENLNILDIRSFNVIGVDTGKFNQESIEYGELLGMAPDYINERMKLNIRVIPDYIP